jgi:hypothetical protein
MLGGTLQGRCFTPNGAKLPEQSVGLNRSYTVTVRRETRGFESQDYPSPIRAVGNAGLAILSIPLVILAIPLVIVAAPLIGAGAGVGMGPGYGR